MFFHSGQIIDRQIIDNIALARQETRYASRILPNFLQHDLLDRNLRPPVVIIARHYQIAIPLPADQFVRSGSDRVLIHLITILVRCGLTGKESIMQTIEKDRVRHFGGNDDGVVVGRLHLSHIHEV